MYSLASAWHGTGVDDRDLGVAPGLEPCSWCTGGGTGMHCVWVEHRSWPVRYYDDRSGWLPRPSRTSVADGGSEYSRTFFTG
jgi:hypothetical protein